MIKCYEIDKFEYEELLNDFSFFVFKNTTQSCSYYESLGFSVIYFKVLLESEVIGIAPIFYVTNKLGYKNAFCYYGPVFKDKSKLPLIIDVITENMKNLKTYEISFVPNIIKTIGGDDTDVELSYDLIDIESFNEIDFHYESDWKSAHAKWNMKWFYIKQLRYKDETELISSYKSIAKRKIKQYKKYCTTKIATQEHIGDVVKMMNDSAIKHGFEPQSNKYYEDVIFNKYDNHIIYIVEFNLKGYLDDLIIKSENLDSESQQAIKIEKVLKKYGNLNEDKVCISTGLFCFSKYELIFSSGGNDSMYNEFNGSVVLQHELMNIAISKNIKIYNFYGIEPDFSPDNGVLRYKQAFNGNHIELYGTFSKVLNKKIKAIQSFIDSFKAGK